MTNLQNVLFILFTNKEHSAGELVEVCTYGTALAKSERSPPQLCLFVDNGSIKSRR